LIEEINSNAIIMLKFEQFSAAKISKNQLHSIVGGWDTTYEILDSKGTIEDSGDDVASGSGDGNTRFTSGGHEGENTTGQDTNPG